jgi:hypothetical protein
LPPALDADDQPDRERDGHALDEVEGIHESKWSRISKTARGAFPTRILTRHAYHERVR